MRPMWVQYPTDANTFAIDDQWMVGSDILVKPVVHEGATSVDVYFPAGQDCREGGDEPRGGGLWYDVGTLLAVRTEGTYLSVEAPLEKIPVFQRGGSIVPRCVGDGVWGQAQQDDRIQVARA